MTLAAPFTIRPAEPADEDALAALDRNGWSAMYAIGPRPEPPYAPFFDRSHTPEQFLVAELPPDGAGPVRAGRTVRGRLAGYVRVVQPVPLPSNAHVRQIQGLLVDESARGRGIARALLDAACERARAEGVLRLTLRVLGHNLPARQLYAAAGFAVEGVLPGEFRLEGAYVDDVLMGRWLTP
ncbi:GNAT family N-acetyltransferase [Streptomyces armeniacus]|uniref:GNAT family N-acetyltransferase n=1 Tax=Streptomyces armeniacus TaxID=83291 RepID=A0A345XMD9_9ACTN|nr:GNAT family N-acetyltransferase [Streptomyces armeniacus]AXK32805.1 GNAT family N-acetyltransferase [Streptomyces armeniacus]